MNWNLYLPSLLFIALAGVGMSRSYGNILLSGFYLLFIASLSFLAMKARAQEMMREEKQ